MSQQSSRCSAEVRLSVVSKKVQLTMLTGLSGSQTSACHGSYRRHYVTTTGMSVQALGVGCRSAELNRRFVFGYANNLHCTLAAAHTLSQLHLLDQLCGHLPDTDTFRSCTRQYLSDLLAAARS